jgi:type I restriction enzyme S subunit
MSWDEAPLRRVFRIVNGGTPTSDKQYWDGDVRWATPADIGAVDGKYLNSTQRSLTEAGVLTGSRTVPSGSIILSTRAPIGYVAQTSRLMAFNQGCRGLIPTVPADMRYFRYQLLSLREELVSRGAGSTFMELSTDALAAVPMVRPPLDEQRRIADFLDAETARRRDGSDGFLDDHTTASENSSART